MSYKTTWFSKCDLDRLCRRVANLRGIEITADMLCDQINGEIASGGYGANVMEKLVREGVPREDAEILLSDLSETADGGCRELFTTTQAAEALGISVQRIKQLCAEGRMGMRVGRDWIITQDDIEANRIRKPGRPPTGDVYERRGEWSGYTVRKSAKGFVVDCWSARQGEPTDDKYLVEYGDGYGPETDLGSRHNELMTVGDYIYACTADPNIALVKVRCLRRGRIVR